MDNKAKEKGDSVAVEEEGVIIRTDNDNSD